VVGGAVGGVGGGVGAIGGAVGAVGGAVGGVGGVVGGVGGVVGGGVGSVVGAVGVVVGVVGGGVVGGGVGSVVGVVVGAFQMGSGNAARNAARGPCGGLMKAFMKWWKEADASERGECAKLADTSLATLYQMSYGTRSNGRPFNISNEFAGRVSSAITTINARPRHKPLPVVGRGDMNPTCAACPYYRKCEEYLE
jgi:hypothetical protein